MYVERQLRFYQIHVMAESLSSNNCEPEGSKLGTSVESQQDRGTTTYIASCLLLLILLISNAQELNILMLTLVLSLYCSANVQHYGHYSNYLLLIFLIISTYSLITC